MTDHRNILSEESSITTNQSSPELLDLLGSSSGEVFGTSLKDSTASSSTVCNTKISSKYICENNRNFTRCDAHSSTWKMQNENYEEMSTNTIDGQNTTGRSSNSDESTSFITGTSSTTETRLSTTDTAKTTDIESDSTRKTDVTSYSDNSDSAYTNSRSNFTQTINSNLTYTSETQHSVHDETNETNTDVEIVKNNKYELKNSADSVTSDNLQVDGFTESSKPQHLSESSTQTPNTANLNVISNVQLSQSTLNVIFNQVLQDVNNKQPNSLNIKSVNVTLPLEEGEEKEQEKQEQERSDSKIINVQPVPSFYLNRKEEIVVTTEHSRVIKYMISNVGAGSPYGKPAEVPQIVVPRYSALPRTSSMEVNTSSVDSTDKESDTISLVDSLEEGFSPRATLSMKEEEKLVKHDDLSILLPDNSEAKKVKSPQKSAVFFIPIENKQKEEFKPVSYHLPKKVKEKLSRRQFKREQKIQQAKSNYTSPRSDSNYISASDNGNQISFTVNNNPEYLEVKSVPVLPEINNHKTKRKSRATLPSIQNITKIKIDSKDNIKYTECERIRDRFSKPIKRKSVTKYEKILSRNENSKQTPLTSKSFHRIPGKLTPIYTSRNEYTCETIPRGIYHKTEFGNANKRIEILEIMECVHDGQRHHSLPKGGKSKIPVLVQNSRLPKIEKNPPPKPVYLDFEEVQNYDPKMDQLIANILIDSLHKYENNSAPSSAEAKSNILKLSNEKRPDDIHLTNNKYQQKFDVIPEELSLQSSLEENSNKSDKMNSGGNLTETAADIITKHVLKNNNIQERLYSSNKASKSSSNENSKTEEPFKINPTLSGNKINDVFAIPQGWITFYMLHKNQGSPDSTSDEGTKLTEKLKIQSETNGFKNELQKETFNEDYNTKDVNTKSERLLENSDEFTMVKKEKSRRDTLDTILSSDAFSDNLNPILATANNERYSKQYSFKNVNNNDNNNNNDKNRFSNSEQCTTHGWSVTVSGMNTYGQLAPDMEMRLKFPVRNENTSCTQNKDDVENVKNNDSNCYSVRRSCQLLKRHNHQNTSNSVVNVNTTDDNYRNGRLPIINQNRKLSQHFDVNLTNTVVPFGFDPRQTKTSTRRYALNRPRNLQSVDTNVTTENILNLSPERIFRKFPDILTVSGNGINPGKRSCLYTNST